MSNDNASAGFVPGGNPGTADGRGLVDMAALAADHESLNTSLSMRREAPPVMPIPYNLPVRSADDPPDQPSINPSSVAVVEPSAFVPEQGIEPSVTASFSAIEYNGSIPPDTHGAAGPEHLIAVHNGTVRVYNHSGAVLSTVSLDAFWATVASGSGTFDPKVLYDQLADRWIMTACDDRRVATSGLLIGVSQTANPTGNWITYKVAITGQDLPWVDYPSIGVNGKWIVVQANVFVEDTFARSHVYVFDKADLYGSGPGRFTWFALESSLGGTQVPAVIEDPAIEVMYLLQNWNGNLNGRGYLRPYLILGGVGSERLVPGTYFSVADTWDSRPPGGEDFAPQLGVPQRIQVNDARIQNVVVPRRQNEGQYHTLYAVHTVLLPAGGSPTRSAIQWWRIASSVVEIDVEEFGRIDDPTGAISRAFPSIAVTSFGGILVGYSSFSASQFPSANYAFRTWDDPPNAPLVERVLKLGEGPYNNSSSGRNRWGDYSSAVREPSSINTNIWIIQEYSRPAQGAGETSGRWGTWWGRISFLEIG